jgi:hypothetical protein
VNIGFELPEELLDMLEERVRAAVRKELAANSNGASPWFDLDGAATYCVMKPSAIDSARKRGQLKGHQSETGRWRYHRDDLDAFLRARDAA